MDTYRQGTYEMGLIIIYQNEKSGMMYFSLPSAPERRTGDLTLSKVIFPKFFLL
jgi:hypothetical protein